MQEYRPIKMCENLRLNLLLIWVVIYQSHYYLFGDIDYFRFYRLGFPTFDLGPIPSSTLVELLMTLMMGINFFYSLREWLSPSHRKRLVPQKVKLLIAWFFAGVVLAVVLGSLNEGFRFVRTELRFNIFFLLFAWYAFHAIKSPEDLKRFFKVFNIGATILSIAASIYLISDEAIRLPFFQVFGEYHLGFDFQFIILLAALYSLFSLMFKGYSLAALIGLVNFIPIILSFIKAVVIPAAVALFTILLFLIVIEKSIAKKTKIIFSIITVSLVLFIVLSPIIEKQFFIGKFEKTYLKGALDLGGNVVIGDIWSGRLDLWASAIKDISSSPIWGHGFGYITDVRWFKYKILPHNLYLRYLAVFGLFGFIPFIMLVLQFLIWNLKQINKKYIRDSYSKIISFTIYCYCLSQFIIQGAGDTASRRPYVTVLLYIFIGLLVKFHILLRNNYNRKVNINAA